MRKYWYRGTTKERLNEARNQGFFAAPVFITSTQSSAIYFARSFRRFHDGTPIVLKLDLTGYDIKVDPWNEIMRDIKPSDILPWYPLKGKLFYVDNDVDTNRVVGVIKILS